MKSGKIPNSAITATSSYSDSYLPQYARLDNTLPSNVHAAWFPKSHDDGQFIQVDLGEITKITRIATQGRYKGFVNKEGKALTAFEFDEVTYFNDSIALVRIENEWMLENIRNEDLLYEQIESFEIIDVGEEDKTLFITTVNGQGIYSESMGEVIQPTYTFIRLLGTPANPVYFAVKLVKEANIYVVIYYDKKGNKLFTQSFRQEEYYKIACPTN